MDPMPSGGGGASGVTIFVVQSGPEDIEHGLSHSIVLDMF
jgi:carboxypeptidase C (cathepsin A)